MRGGFWFWILAAIFCLSCFHFFDKIYAINNSMTTLQKQLKNPPIKSRVLNTNASNNQQVQNYQKQVVEKVKKAIEKIDEEIKQLEQTQ